MEVNNIVYKFQNILLKETKVTERKPNVGHNYVRQDENGRN